MNLKLVAVLYAGSSNKKKVIIGGVVGGVGLLMIVLAVFLLYRQSRKPQTPERVTDIVARVQDDINVIEQGTLKNGHVVAVKKLAMLSSRAKADFDTEVRLISNVHHCNLIRLLGCSNKGAEIVLIYQ
uniref:Serine-threonine/tyrosine-protein kinase catalytic domain-containing protein n=1 Tax=Solanum lycopersicum TaxID=4081 RepID=A0A3Q7JJD7_SOLLC